MKTVRSRESGVKRMDKIERFEDINAWQTAKGGLGSNVLCSRSGQ